MRSLITGVGGFAGQHLASWLLARDESVWGVARGPVDWRDPALVAADRFHLLTADLTEQADVRRAVEAASPDRVYHLAAQSSVGESFVDPLGILNNNTAALVHLLEALRAIASSARVLVVSSSEVYGRAGSASAIDEAAPLRPESPYAVSKCAVDLFAYQYGVAYGLDIVRVRPFNHIGPGQSERFVAASFAHQIAEIERGDRAPVIEVGNVSAMRDFTDVRDMVRAYELALSKGESGAVYNVGRGAAVSIAQILEMLSASSTAEVEIRVDPARLRQVDAPLQVCDGRLFHGQTGWEPEITIEKTLVDILDDWRSRVTAA